MSKVIYLNGQPLTIGGGVALVPDNPGTAPAQLQSPTHFNVVNTGAGGELNFVLTALPVDNGSAITDVEYSLDGGGWISLPSYAGVGTYAITGLNNDQSYNIAARCSNANGVQLDPPQSVDRIPTSTATVPAQIADNEWALIDTEQGGQLQLSFSTPPDDGGSIITGYEYRIGVAAAVQFGVSVGVYFIDGLTNDTAIDVQIRAVNSIGNAAWSPVKSRTPTLVSAGGYTPDASVATASALSAQLSAWDGNTGGATKYVRVTADITGGYTANNYSFPDGVVVYGDGEDCSININGVDIYGCDNLNFDFIASTGDVSRIQQGSTGCFFRFSTFEGAPAGNAPALNHGIQIGAGGGARTDNCGVIECLVSRFNGNGIHVLNADNTIIRKNGAPEPGKDCFVGADANGIIFDRNWGPPLDKNPPAAHLDFIQGQPANNNGLGCVNVSAVGNVHYECDFDHPTGLPFSHGIFLSTTAVHAGVFTDNFVAPTNQNGLVVNGVLPTTIEYNTVLALHDTGLTASQNTRAYVIPPGGATVRYNVERRDDAGPGTGGLSIDWADYDTHFGALKLGGDTWNTLGPGGDFSDAMPQAGSVMHWDHVSPIGAFNRLREIFVDGNHPGNSVNVVLSAWWHAVYNKHGRITS